MRLKFFRLRDGKLEYMGIHEVMQGDAILEGESSMAEVSAGSELLSLRESYAGPTAEEMRASWKRFCPNASEKELDILVSGIASEENNGWFR